MIKYHYAQWGFSHENVQKTAVLFIFHCYNSLVIFNRITSQRLAEEAHFPPPLFLNNWLTTVWKQTWAFLVSTICALLYGLSVRVDEEFSHTQDKCMEMKRTIILTTFVSYRTTYIVHVATMTNMRLN